MKKILLFLLIFTLAFSIGISADEPFLEFSFSTNADAVHTKGDVIECVISYKDINEKGLSSAELFIEFSDGLAYNSDAVATGLADEWSLWSPSVDGGVLKIGIVDDSATTPGVSDFEIKLSFTVVSDSFSRQYIGLSEYLIYDFDINAVETVKADIKEASFVVNLPEASLENVGAALRLNNTPALRFGVRKEALPENAEIGVIAIESDKLEGELTHSSEGALLFDADLELASGVFTTSPMEISSNSEKYTFRPFAGLKMEDGNVYFVYFEPLERSAVDIATSELDAETDGTKRALLEGFLIGT